MLVAVFVVLLLAWEYIIWLSTVDTLMCSLCTLIFHGLLFLSCFIVLFVVYQLKEIYFERHESNIFKIQKYDHSSQN